MVPELKITVINHDAETIEHPNRELNQNFMLYQTHKYISNTVKMRWKIKMIQLWNTIYFIRMRNDFQERIKDNLIYNVIDL